MNKGPASHVLSCPVVFISTRYENQQDIMTATAMFVSEKDPILVVSLAKGHLTSQLVDKAGGFTAIAASPEQEDLYEKLTGARGSVGDKFAAFSIATLPEESGKPLIPKGSSAWFECKTLNKQELENYLIITARVTGYDDLGKPPLLWQKEGLFTTKPL